MKLIVEMEMPKCCWECACCDTEYQYCVASRKQLDDLNERPSWCPIKGVLPDEHGDLVDTDTVLWGEVLDSEGIVLQVPVTIGDVIDGYDVPIVIAAERKDE